MLTQIEACLTCNSHPWWWHCGVDCWTFPLKSKPSHSHSCFSLGLLRRLYLWQGLVRHFQERWRNKCIFEVWSYSKWRGPRVKLEMFLSSRRTIWFPHIAQLLRLSKLMLELMVFFEWSLWRPRMTLISDQWRLLVKRRIPVFRPEFKSRFYSLLSVS